MPTAATAVLCGASPLSASPFAASASSRSPRSRARWQVKAMGAEARDNLDQLQRLNHHLQQQPQPKQQSSPLPPPPRRRVVQSAPVGLWDRFPTARTIQQMIDTMDRIMEDPLSFSTVPLPSQGGGGGEEGLGSYRRGRTPWEIREGEGEYKMRFDMPAMTKEDVKVWVEEKMLVIKAEKNLAAGSGDRRAAGGEDDWTAASYGRYNSRIALPDNVILEKIKAEVRDGVLYITIPKASSAAKVMDIDVQ